MVVHQANRAILPLNLFSPSLSLLWFSTLQRLNPFSHVFLLFIASVKWVNNDYPQYFSCRWSSSGLFLTYMGLTLEKGISGIGILNRHRVLLDGGVFKGIAEVFYGLNSEPSWVSRSPQLGAWPPTPPGNASQAYCESGTSPMAHGGLLVVGRLLYTQNVPNYFSQQKLNISLKLNFSNILSFTFVN